VKTLILGLIQSSILFQNLSEKDENIVIDAMEEKIVSKGDHIINEGEKGDSLYIVAEG
jgi:cAMP-dependent protein kinase regulator